MATRTFRGTINSNYSLAANWAEVATPTNADDVVFDASSPNCTLDSGCVAKTITATNYTHTLNWATTLTVSGLVTWGVGMTHSGTADLIVNTTATLTSGGTTMSGGLQLAGTTPTYTLSGAWVINGVLTAAGSGVVTLNSSTLSVAGGLNSNNNLLGTTVITMTGGTWSGAGLLRNSLTFAGNITISGTVIYGTGTLTYSSGTITTSGSTLSFTISSTQSITFNTVGMSWNNISINGSGTNTITLNSLLTVTGTLTLPNAACIFAGTAGFSVATLTNTVYTATRTITYVNGVTYTITGSYTTGGVTPTIRQTIKSASAGNKAILTLSFGASQFIGFTDPTDIDSSQGQQIFSYSGVITNTLNWSNGNAPIGKLFVIQASGSY